MNKRDKFSLEKQVIDAIGIDPVMIRTVAITFDAASMPTITIAIADNTAIDILNRLFTAPQDLYEVKK